MLINVAFKNSLRNTVLFKILYVVFSPRRGILQDDQRAHAAAGFGRGGGRTQPHRRRSVLQSGGYVNFQQNIVVGLGQTFFKITEVENWVSQEGFVANFKQSSTLPPPPQI